MTTMIPMPVLRQIRRTPEGPLWRRLLGLRAPVVYEIVERYEYETWMEGRPVTLCLPAGFRSDLASTPSASWILGFRPDGVLCLGGWFHDWCYRHGSLLEMAGGGPQPCFAGRGKLWADRLLAKITAETAGLKTPGWIALAGLAVGGWSAWRANAKYREIAARLPAPGYDETTLKGEYADD